MTFSYIQCAFILLKLSGDFFFLKKKLFWSLNPMLRHVLFSFFFDEYFSKK